MSPDSTALPFRAASSPRTEAAGERERITSQTARTGWRHREWPWLTLLSLIVTFTWTAHYDRWDRKSWKTPPVIIAEERWAPWKIAFGGDALWGMAATKAHAEGEIGFFSKRPAPFGAPFVANWNDWLTAEEGVAAWWALLVKLLGLFPGSNLAVLSGHLLAAASFYLVCRYFRYEPAISLAGAALFALSRYAFWRGLPHLGLLYYWHLPFGFLVLWWCFRGESILANKTRSLFCLGLAVVYGFHSPYYAAMFVQLLAGASACAVVRTWDWRKALPAALMISAMVATFIFMNVDTLWHRLLHGPNPEAFGRSYLDVERWALKPVELFVPFSHSLETFARWATRAYYDRTIIIGEGGSPYLGVVSIFALGWLLWQTLRGVARQEFRLIPLHLWCILWVLAYCVIGGATGVLGLWDIFLIRATNRCSLFILAAALFFLVKQLSAHSRKWRPQTTYGVATFILAIGIYDQVPPWPAHQAKATERMLKDDKNLVEEIEAKLPPGALIFQLPVMTFPEAFAIERMIDYEPFRPYLHSSQLRFSYGDNKGRYRDRWQREAEMLGPAGLIDKLEKYGFSAVLINRRGYADRSSAQESFRAAGRERVLGRSRDFICIELNPLRRPSLPPEFADGWYSLEGNAAQNIRWSYGDARLVLHHAERQKRSTSLRFQLTAKTNRYVEIWRGSRLLYHGVIGPNQPRPVKLTLKLERGANELHFKTDRAGEIPADSEKRPLAFAVMNFTSSR